MPFVVTTKRPCPACGQELELRDGGSGPMWYGHGDSEEPGHVGGGPDEAPWCIRENESGGGAPPISRRAVATLEERIVFNSREWERAGYDQPDGNLQFFHHALILSRRPSRQRWMPKDEVAEVLWLHDGTISSGHFVGMMDMPSEPTRADRERFPDFPERWPGRLIPESGGTVGPLPDGTVIEVEMIGWPDLANRVLDAAAALVIEENADGPAATLVKRQVLDAFNAREAGAKS